MHITRTHQAGLALVALLTLGCSDSNAPLPPPTGVIELTISTTGAAGYMDPDGYFLAIDGGSLRPVAVNAVVDFGALQNGKHRIEINGLAPNCTIEGLSNSVEVDITAQTGAASRVLVSYHIVCAAPSTTPDPWGY